MSSPVSNKEEAMPANQMVITVASDDMTHLSPNGSPRGDENCELNTVAGRGLEAGGDSAEKTTGDGILDSLNPIENHEVPLESGEVAQKPVPSSGHHALGLTEKEDEDRLPRANETSEPGVAPVMAETRSEMLQPDQTPDNDDTAIGDKTVDRNVDAAVPEETLHDTHEMNKHDEEEEEEDDKKSHKLDDSVSISPALSEADISETPGEGSENPKTGSLKAAADLKELPKDEGVRSKRTRTMPSGIHFSVPWRKKPNLDDSKEHLDPKEAEQENPAKTSTSANPLAGMMKSLKKGFKIRIGGAQKRTEDPAPGRIPQNVGARPSPRIVSSLNLTPTSAAEAAATLEEGEPHFEEIIPEQKATGTVRPAPPTPDTPEQPINEAETVEGPQQPLEETSAQIPPRPPPAQEVLSSLNSPKSPTERTMFPPPRPVCPPQVMRNCRTLNISRAPLTEHPITPKTADPSVLSASPANLAMRNDYVDRSLSLDRRSLYRSKEENKQIRRSTLSRPKTIHETTMIVKQKPTGTLDRSFNENTTPSATKQKIILELRDTITFPKLPSVLKKQRRSTPIARPQLAPALSVSRAGSRLLTANTDQGSSYRSGGFVNISGVEASMLSGKTRFSIGIQTEPLRVKYPVTSIFRTLSWREDQQFPHRVQQLAELQLPFMSQCLSNHQDDVAPSASRALQRIHSVWSEDTDHHPSTTTHDRDESTGCPEVLKRCLQDYLSVCINLRCSGLPGEFAAFHWQCGDLQEAGWSELGVPGGWPSLVVYHDPIGQIAFVKLPRHHHEPGSFVYPECTFDAMLATWIDIGGTQALSSPRPDPLSAEGGTTFHPASAIFTLTDLLSAVSSVPLVVRSSLAVAILLSFEYCTANMARNQNSSSIALSLDPSHILLVCSPANPLVLFRIVENNDRGQFSRIEGLIQDLCPEYNSSRQVVSVDANINALIGLANSNLPLHTIIRSIAPPDWIMMAVARTSLGRNATNENDAPVNAN